MNDGECYTIQNSTTLYRYPDLSCSEGGFLPAYQNTRRDTFTLVNGRYIFTSRQNVTNYGGNNTIAHIWKRSDLINYDANNFIIPAVAIVLIFFNIIYHFFVRKRS